MAESPNIDRARTADAAFARGDVDALRPYLGAGIVGHIPGRSPMPGTFKGVDERTVEELWS